MSRVSSKFMHDIQKEIDMKVRRPLTLAVRETAMLGYNQVTMLRNEGGRTPLFTGFYRGNWRLTITKTSNVGFGTSSITSAEGPVGNRIDQFASSYASARSSAERSVSSFSINSHKGFYLTNNTSYASDIEQGLNYYGPGDILGTAIVKMKIHLDQKVGRI